MSIAMFKRRTHIVICFCLFFFIKVFFFSEKAKADFFSTCGIDGEDMQKMSFVLGKGNDKLIPHEIFEIKNKTFQDAVYLLLFYKNNSVVPDDVIESVGVDTLKYIPSFKKKTLNYILKTGVGFEDEAKKHLVSIDLELDDLMFILSNKYFQQNNYGESFTKSILRRVFLEYRLTADDVLFLKTKFHSKVTDDFILNQIRLSLWDKDINSGNKLEQFIISKSIKNKARKLMKFSNDIGNIKQSYHNSVMNDDEKIINKQIDDKIQNICNKWLGYDEYVDLVCIEKSKKRNKKIVKKILRSNLNPSFLPNKWLQYRVNFVRDAINLSKKPSYDVYKIAFNSGTLHGSDYYSQMFLAGFVAYLRNDYENAILCFNECAENSNYAEYNAKANYWLGLAYRKFGERRMAEFSFRKAKRHIFTMYGQLAAEEIGEDPRKNIEDYILFSDKNMQLLCDDTNFVFSYLRQYEIQHDKRNKGRRLSELLRYFIIKNRKDKEKIFNAMVIVKNDFGRNIANLFGVYTLEYGVLSNDIDIQTSYSNDSLVNAVIKKESNFRNIIGSFGEHGLMQIMPSTGYSLAKEMGIKYDQKRLLEDGKYNADIGSFYLEKLLYKYDDNKILALAAYNAGVGSVEKWITRNGNPSDMKTNEQIVNWIEKIPFFYTRSYITNILGFEMVYDVINNIKSISNRRKNKNNNAVVSKTIGKIDSLNKSVGGKDDEYLDKNVSEKNDEKIDSKINRETLETIDKIQTDDENSKNINNINKQN